MVCPARALFLRERQRLSESSREVDWLFVRIYDQLASFLKFDSQSAPFSEFTANSPLSSNVLLSVLSVTLTHLYTFKVSSWVTFLPLEQCPKERLHFLGMASPRKLISHEAGCRTVLATPCMLNIGNKGENYWIVWTGAVHLHRAIISLPHLPGQCITSSAVQNHSGSHFWWPYFLFMVHHVFHIYIYLFFKWLFNLAFY